MGLTILGRGQGDSNQTDPNSGMGQTEQTFANTGPDETDRRPTRVQTEKTRDLGQTEQTQGQPWTRPKIPSRPNKRKTGIFKTDENRRFLRFETNKNRRFLNFDTDKNRRFLHFEIDEKRRFLHFETDEKRRFLHFETDEKRRFLHFETDEKRRFLRFNTDVSRSKRRKKRKSFDRYWRSKSDDFFFSESDEILNVGPLDIPERFGGRGLIYLLPPHSYVILPHLEAHCSPKRFKSFELHFALKNPHITAPLLYLFGRKY